MKRIFAAAVIATGLLATTAQADVLAHWTFEVSAPTTAGPHAAEAGLFGGSASALHASGSTVYSNPVGNGSSESFSSNNWGIGDYYQFTTSTIGYQSITVQWDQTRSSTGPGTFMLQWSDNGIDFSDLLEYDIEALSWSSVTYNEDSTFAAFALPAGANNLATVWIRMTNQVTPGGTAGSNRIDDVIISGNVIPVPGALALLAVAGLAAGRRRRSLA